MFTKLRPLLEPILDIITKPFLWIPPDLISLIGFLISAASGVALAYNNNILAGFFFSGNILDAFDGYIARKKGKTTKFGGLFDTVLDRFVEASIFFGAAAGNYISFEFAFVGMFMSTMVSFTKAVATSLLGETKVGTNVLSIGIGQRGDRLLILMIGAFTANLYLFNTYSGFAIATSLVILSSFITFIMRMNKAYQLLKD